MNIRLADLYGIRTAKLVLKNLLIKHHITVAVIMKSGNLLKAEAKRS